MSVDTLEAGGFDAAGAFLAGAYKDPEGKPAAAPVEAPDDAVDDDPTAVEKAALARPDAVQQPAGADDPDDAEVEWGEGEAKSKAKLRELKEAFAKRAAVDKDAASLGEVRSAALAKSAQAETALSKLVERAEAAWRPYSTIDFLALSRDPSIDQATFAQIRADANEALSNYQYLTTELSTAAKARSDAAAKDTQARAQVALKELQDPVKGIPGFDGAMFNKIAEHTVTTYGASKDVLNGVSDAWMVRVLHDAMLYRQGAAKAAEGVAKVVNRPTKVLSPGPATGSTGAATDRRAIVDRLRNSERSVEDAADAFLALSRRAR